MGHFELRFSEALRSLGHKNDLTGKLYVGGGGGTFYTSSYVNFCCFKWVFNFAIILFKFFKCVWFPMEDVSEGEG